MQLTGCPGSGAEGLASSTEEKALGAGGQQAEQGPAVCPGSSKGSSKGQGGVSRREELKNRDREPDRERWTKKKKQQQGIW